MGDPQFVGLLGQSYQVHGVDGAVYSLISDSDVQVMSRFVYLSHGQCLRDDKGEKVFTCWSHPGSYLSNLALQTAHGDRLLVQSGGALMGFSTVTFNHRPMMVGDTVTGRANLTIRYINLRSLRIDHAGLWSVTLENSDGFLNLLSLSVSSWTELTTRRQSHGLIGQTWRRDQRGMDVREVEGTVDDYAELTNDEFGCGVVYDRAHHRASEQGHLYKHS